MQARRKSWRVDIAGYEAKDLIFLDESGININMTRLYGRSVSSERVIDNAPLNTPTITTILSSISMSGEMAHTTYSGGTTTAKFHDYLKDVLFPTLNEHSVLVMDNMQSHHARDVKKLLDENHVHYIYLPPYSPDLNPIEKLWSKLKAFLRKWKVRTPDELPNAVDKAFQCVCQKDCEGWFKSCGICAN